MSAYYQETNGHNGMSVKQRNGNGNGNYSQRNSVDEYMVPEEEWEREAVLDPAWERQQKKVRNSKNVFRKKNCVFRHLRLGVIHIYVKLKHQLKILKKIFKMV
jgi:hypothetical protein